MVCWFAAALLLLAAAGAPRFRTWLLARRSHWLRPSGLFAALYIGAVVIPPAVEQSMSAPTRSPSNGLFF
jgi:hypothetical protein